MKPAFIPCYRSGSEMSVSYSVKGFSLFTKFDSFSKISVIKILSFIIFFEPLLDFD